MTRRLAAPATVWWMVRGEEQTPSEIDGGCQDGIEISVDPAEREDMKQDAGVRACFRRSWIFPL